MKSSRALIASLIVFSVSSAGSAFGQSSDSILRRLEALEQSNKSLASENTELRSRLRRLEIKEPKAQAIKSAPSLTASAELKKAPTNYKSAQKSLDWNGAYIGAHVGYVLGDFSLPTLADETDPKPLPSAVTLKGALGGFQFGYNYRFAPNWVIGIENDMSFGQVSGEKTQTISIHAKTTYSGTVRQRFGYVWDSFLIYQTAGVAWALNEAQLIVPADPVRQVTDKKLHFGVAVGAGLEYAVAPNTSIKIEYLYSYLTKEQYFSATSDAAVASWPLSIIRGGLNWHF